MSGSLTVSVLLLLNNLFLLPFLGDISLIPGHLPLQYTVFGISVAHANNNEPHASNLKSNRICHLAQLGKSKFITSGIDLSHWKFK